MWTNNHRLALGLSCSHLVSFVQVQCNIVVVGCVVWLCPCVSVHVIGFVWCKCTFQLDCKQDKKRSGKIGNLESYITLYSSKCACQWKLLVLLILFLNHICDTRHEKQHLKNAQEFFNISIKHLRFKLWYDFMLQMQHFLNFWVPHWSFYNYMNSLLLYFLDWLCVCFVLLMFLPAVEGPVVILQGCQWDAC